jgi:hypothetical protein
MKTDCSCTECALRKLVEKLEAKIKEQAGEIERLSDRYAGLKFDCFGHKQEDK